MDITNCPECGKLFKKVGKKICPECIQKEEEDFLKVKQYLDDNPGATVPVVAEETEVSEKRINNFIREGRLEASSFENISVSCMSCGAPTKRGKYCSDCTGKLQSDLEKAMGEKKEEKKEDDDRPKEGGKIHIRDRFKDK
ncbi:TIGR03826 family flagellar region protein [Natranaerofaba carboxydovora]|uniref:TIGR03826 family flagellar region protein n=1 Tax=Natranaerofaba carboxydovora TaxID=2742683 RepID=UPI001F138434|nr:TIGR03826 family flagellar region protein [Natranaerofaba carboxydovora]UMZ74999.1 YvyF: flagellar operon protein [Natranaerofaba carboxydovora]